MPPEFDQQARRCGESLIRLALQEDLQDVGDLTSLATIPSAQQASVNIVSRGHGIFAAAELIPLVFAALQADVQIRQLVANGELIQPGTTIAQVSGDVRMLLIATDNPELPDPSLWCRIPHRAVRRCCPKHQRNSAGHAEDPPGLASTAEIRRPLRRRNQSPDGAV